MKFITVLLAVFAVLCSVQAAPAPQFALAGSPLALPAYSGYSPYVFNSGYYNPYNTVGYNNVGFSVGGLSPYTGFF